MSNDDDRAELDPEALAKEEDAQVEAATEAASSADPRADEVRLLDEMTRIAEEARGLPDARVRRLIDWVREHQCPALPRSDQPARDRSRPQWNDTRVLIFTEYEDTLRYLRQQLEAAIEGTDRAEERIEVYHGPTPPDRREEMKRAFNANPAKHPVRILLATDAAREGINLQTHCWNLFHFDVPWNPSRMEQRNGRIDRKLQPRDEVYCHYFVYRQRPEDRVLQALVRKTEIIKRELGSLAQVIEGKLADTLTKSGIRRAEIDRLETEIDTADLGRDFKEIVGEELEVARERQDELREQIDALRGRLKESKDWVGLHVDDFRAALSSGLELLGAAPLQEASGAGRFVFPALDRRAGGDPSWANTLDALRAPRPREQAFWEWRRESAIRPVVFEDPGTMTDEVVHLHLEHRVVQRLLSRFTTQGFVYNDLSRACFAQTADPIPRVILIGRLCLYGAGAARLHEVLIPVTARWIDPEKRKGSLTPYGREAEGNTLQLLEEALRKAVQPANEVMLRKLQATGPRDVAELLPHLEKRGRDLAEGSIRRLTERGEKEAQAMLAILESQRKRIAETVEKHRDTQLGLFKDEELRQLEADRRHWGRRLADLESELTTEPVRIRGVYVVKAQRVEPVGLVYLWPETN